MHISEWSSVLYNLYTNSKKAIKRARNLGKLKIITGEENGKIDSQSYMIMEMVYPKKIYLEFLMRFSLHPSAGFDAPLDEKLTELG